MKLKPSKKKKIVGASAFLAAALISPSVAFADVDMNDDIDQLQSEVAELRQVYRNRVDALERRLKSLENENEEQHEALERAAEQAEKAAQIAYGSSKTASEAKEETAALSADFATRPWRSEEVTDGPGGFEFHGFFRSGYAVNSRGGSNQGINAGGAATQGTPGKFEFKAPGAGGKYRLGNEYETLVDLTMVYNYQNPDWQKEGINVKTQVDFNIVSEGNKAFDSTGTALSLADCFAEIEGVWAAHKEAKFWAGQRLYKQQNVYINDFYYLDFAGVGGGVHDVDFLDGKLAVAYIGTNQSEPAPNGSGIFVAGNTSFNNTGRQSKNILDVRYSEFEVPFGKGEIVLDLAASKGGITSAGSRIDTNTGYAISFIHTHDNPLTMPGVNKAIVQYGRGTVSNLESAVQDADFIRSNAWTFRAIETFIVHPSESLSMQVVGIYQTKTSGKATDNRQTWLSLGARPTYYFNKHWSIAVEGGVDYVSSRLGTTSATTGTSNRFNGALYKLTVAPQITPDLGFTTRPALRAYASYFKWTDGFKGRIDSVNNAGGAPLAGSPAGPYVGKNQAIVVGIQAEAWW